MEAAIVVTCGFSDHYLADEAGAAWWTFLAGISFLTLKAALTVCLFLLLASCEER